MNLKAISNRSILLLALSLLGLAGCGATSTVNGVVTYEGAAVEEGQIVFRPSAEGVKPAAGKIGSDGSFELRTAGNKPLVPGDYSVLYLPPPDREDENGRVVSQSKWGRLAAPTAPIEIEPGANTVPIELQKR